MFAGLRDCDVFYGKAQALQGVSVEIPRGGAVSLIGRNGAGKSTILKTIVGLLQPKQGARVFRGIDETRRRPHELGRMGIGYVPEDRRIFRNLSVRENLLLAASARRAGPWTMQRILKLFPPLAPRLEAGGDTLSGGEQQMLAIGRSLLTNPDLLLLDEPTEGLAPLVVRDLVAAMQAIHREGVGILIVEQNFRIPLQLAEHQYMIDSGRVVWHGTTAEFQQQRAQVEAMLGV